MDSEKKSNDQQSEEYEPDEDFVKPSTEFQRPDTHANQRRAQSNQVSRGEPKIGFVKPDEQRAFQKNPQSAPMKEQQSSIEHRSISAKHPKGGKGASPLVSAKSGDRHFGQTSKEFIKQSAGPFSLKHQAEYARMRPKIIHQDKEKLYDETLHLKYTINALKDENIHLRTKIHNMEKEFQKYEKMFQEANSYTGLFQNKEASIKANESYLVMSLKKEVKDLKNIIKVKDAELLAVKKTIKFTKVQEIDIQLKVFQDENVRLKAILENVLENKKTLLANDDEDKQKLQEEYFIQSSQIKTLQRDNEEMAAAIKVLEEQNYEFEKKIVDLDKKLKREQTRHKKHLHEKERELKKLQNNEYYQEASNMISPSSILKRPNTSASNKEEAYLRQELEGKNQQIQELRMMLNQKDSQINNLERIIATRKRPVVDIIDGMDSQDDRRDNFSRNNLENENQEEEGENPGSSFEPRPIGSKNMLDDPARKVNFKEVEENTVSPRSRVEEDENNKSGQVNKKSRRVKKLRIEDVREIGYKLNFQLRSRKYISYNDLFKDIFPIGTPMDISIAEMIDILKAEPFSMTNEENAILAARYLIEDNKQEYIMYDETAVNNVSIIKSIMKQMVGKLPNWSEQDKIELEAEIYEIMKEYGPGIRDNIKAISRTKDDSSFSKKEFMEACKLMNIKFPEEQLDYILTVCYNQTLNFEKLPLAYCFDYFMKPPSSSLKNNQKKQEEEEPPQYQPPTQKQKELEYHQPEEKPQNTQYSQQNTKSSKPKDDDYPQYQSEQMKLPPQKEELVFDQRAQMYSPNSQGLTMPSNTNENKPASAQKNDDDIGSFQVPSRNKKKDPYADLDLGTNNFKKDSSFDKPQKKASPPKNRYEEEEEPEIGGGKFGANKNQDTFEPNLAAKNEQNLKESLKTEDEFKSYRSPNSEAGGKFKESGKFALGSEDYYTSGGFEKQTLGSGGGSKVNIRKSDDYGEEFEKEEDEGEKDQYEGDAFGNEEKGDGKQTLGEYDDENDFEPDGQQQGKNLASENYDDKFEDDDHHGHVEDPGEEEEEEGDHHDNRISQNMINSAKTDLTNPTHHTEPNDVPIDQHAGHDADQGETIDNNKDQVDSEDEYQLEEDFGDENQGKNAGNTQRSQQKVNDNYENDFDEEVIEDDF